MARIYKIMIGTTKNKVILLIAIIVLAMFVLRFSSEERQDDLIVLESTLDQDSLVERSLEDLKELKEEAGIEWKLYLEHKDIESGSLPDEIKALTLFKEELEAEKATNNEGGQVFVIDYVADVPLGSLYKIFISAATSSGWQIVNNKKTSFAAFVEIKHEEYRAFVDFVSPSNGSTHVIMDIIKI